MHGIRSYVFAALLAFGCGKPVEEDSTFQQSQARLVSLESLVGDKDGFGTGQPCGFQFSNINDFNPEADDPSGTDVVMVTSSYTPPLATNPYATNPKALKPPTPLVHRVELRSNCPITAVELEMCTADVDDGPISWINDQLFLDGTEVSNAFDTTSQYISGVAGYTGVVRFDIPSAFWNKLSDGQLVVRVDETGRSTTEANISEILAIDYSLLKVRQDCSAFSDVVVTHIEVEPACVNGQASIRATVLNQGEAATAANLPVAFYRGNPAAGGTLLGISRVAQSLASGQSAVVQLLTAPNPQPVTVYAVADDDGTGQGLEAESREDNNAASAQLTLSCAGSECIELRLSDYNLFLLEDYSGGHDVQGKVAVGGNLTMTDFSVGTGMPISDIARTLVAGGTLRLSRGGVWGDAWYGSSYSADSSVTFYRGSASQGLPIDFVARGAELRSLSSRLSSLAPNGTTTLEPWGGVMLRGTDPSVNVFQVSANAFSGATLLSVEAPAGSLAVINIAGSTATFSNFGHSFSGGIDQHGVLFNFVEATAINAQGYGFWGTVLAPYAHVTFRNGSWDGGFYARSMSGNAGGHINPLYERDICDI